MKNVKLSLLLTLAVVLLAFTIAMWFAVSPLPVHGAAWLAPAASDTLSADWVKQIEAALRTREYNELFINAPNSPHSAILHLLNSAGYAIQDGNHAYARDLIDEALRIVDDGIRRGWYSRAEVEPVKSMIRSKAEAGLKDVASQDPISPERWTGYTAGRPYGLTERLDEAHPASRFEDEARYDKPSPAERAGSAERSTSR
jgi:hypothetical protein